MEGSKSVQLILRLPDNLVPWIRQLIHVRDEQGNQEPFIEIRPDLGLSSDFYLFMMNGSTYPAMLENLPTVVESHKTFDKKIFIKSGDIGQVLTVFNSPAERESASKLQAKSSIGENIMRSGLTPPSHDVVRKKFDQTRKKDSFPPTRVRMVLEDINTEWKDSLATTAIVGNKNSRSTGQAKIQPRKSLTGGNQDPDMHRIYVHEEVVDFEDWMCTETEPNGVKFVVNSKDLEWVDNSTIIDHPAVLDLKDDYFEYLRVETERNASVIKIPINSLVRNVDSIVNTVNQESDDVEVLDQSRDAQNLLDADDEDIEEHEDVVEGGDDEIQTREFLGTKQAEIDDIAQYLENEVDSDSELNAGEDLDALQTNACNNSPEIVQDQDMLDDNDDWLNA